jgi:hypothetical protein
MDEVKLNFEDPSNPEPITLPLPLYDPEYACEFDGCRAEAKTHWEAADGDGETYYTVRCDDHPPKNSEFTARDI